jgi:hypothetical protein
LPMIDISDRYKLTINQNGKRLDMTLFQIGGIWAR